MRMTVWCERAIVFAALLFVLASIILPLQRQGSSATIAFDGVSGFRTNGVYPTTPALPRDVPGIGSWIGGDGFIGTARTQWSPAESEMYLFVAGYPNDPNMSLRAETRCGSVVRDQPMLPDNPGERWTPITVRLPPCNTPLSVRIVAHDGSSVARGWLGFSAFVSRREAYGEGSAFQALRFAGSTLLAIVLVFLPGLFVGRIVRRSIGAGYLALPGLTLLLFAGGCAWLANGVVPGSGMLGCRCVALAGLFAALVWMLRNAGSLIGELPYKRLFGIGLCVIVIASGRALYAPGPSGELYGGTVSRTFEPGDRSDSRISFHVVQLVANGAGPYSSFAQTMFAPWSFSDRGPIAGIAAAPLVLLAGAAPPVGMPDQTWSPFDVEGFAAYRVGMIVFASTVLFALFSLAYRVAGARAAQFAIAIAALAPFVLHETWFTWPKLLAASFALIAATLVSRRSHLAAGIAVGVAYLVHPSTLFVLPSLVAYIVLLNRGSLRYAAVPSGLLVAGPLFAMGLWRVINGSHYTQAGFIGYILDDDGRGPGFVAWLTDRAISLADTLVPFFLPFANSSTPQINALGAHSSVAVHLDFAYWATLPFGIGLFYLIPFCRLALVAARRETFAFLAVVVAPFVIFWFYWGEASSGLMREGLQWWFFVLIAYVAVTAERSGALERWPSAVLLRLRGLEIAFLALAPAMLDNGRVLSAMWPRTDVLALAAVIGGCCALAYIVLPRPGAA